MLRRLSGVRQAVGPELSVAVLIPVVGSLFGNGAMPVDWSVESIDYDARSAISAGVYLVTGRAVANGRRREWSAVLKVLQATGDTDRRSYGYWLREIHAYEQGPLPDGDLAAPRLLTIQAPTRTTRWLWTDYVCGRPGTCWSGSDLVLAAQRLGGFQGQFVANAVPARDWWCTSFVDSGAPEWRLAQLTGLLDHWATLRGTGLVDDLPELWRAVTNSIAGWLDRLRRTTQTVGHGDFGVQNLLTDDSGRTVALDWAHMNRGPVADDLSVMFATAARRLYGPMDLDDLGNVESDMLASYAAGLNAKEIPRREIDAAYRLSSAIHFGLALGEDAAQLTQDTAGEDPKLRFSVAFGARALRNALALS